jgi:G protein beta subunit-like protein
MGHQRWVWDCAFSADSAYLVTGEHKSSTYIATFLCLLPASSDHTARLWEMSSGETVRQYNGHHKGRILVLFQTNLNYDFCIAAVCCALHDGAS